MLLRSGRTVYRGVMGDSEESDQEGESLVNDYSEDYNNQESDDPAEFETDQESDDLAKGKAEQESHDWAKVEADNRAKGKVDEESDDQAKCDSDQVVGDVTSSLSSPLHWIELLSLLKEKEKLKAQLQTTEELITKHGVEVNGGKMAKGCKTSALKRKRAASRSALLIPRKCLRRNPGSSGEEDRISELPDDILVHILSYMNCKEAARTSVLSSRWKEVWMYTPNLDFDVMGYYMKFTEDYALIPGEAAKYVDCVNRVLKHHKAKELITEFKVRFDIRKCHQGYINDWVKFACSTQRLEKLDFSLLDARQYWHNEPETSIFPNPLTLSSGDCFRNLKELCLKSINVSDEVLAYFVGNCQLLEQLIVHYSHHLQYLQVTGPNLKLKHLELLWCDRLKLVRVSDTNIVSILFEPGAAELQLDNVPSLVSITYCRFLEPFECALSCLSCCIFSQLEMLKLSLSYRFIQQMEMKEYPQLTKVKELAIYSDPRKDFSLIGLASLLRASPNLQTFVLDLNWCEPDRARREWKEALESPLKYLKEVVVYGYYGCTSEVELLACIFRNSNALEIVTIDPRELLDIPFPLPPRDVEARQAAERVAACHAEKQLRQIARPHLNLFIISRDD